MKKLLCILLSLVIALSFSACAKPINSGQPATGEHADNLSESQAVAEAFMDAYSQFEFKDAIALVKDGDAIELPFENLDSLFDTIKTQASETMGATGMEDYIISDLLIPVFDEYTSAIDYSIKSGEEKDGEYVFTVEIEYIDPNALSTLDIGDEAEQRGQELAMEALTDGTITEDMTEEELMEALIGPMMKAAADICIEEIRKLDKTTETFDLTVVEDNGDYLIESNSNIEQLLDMSALKDFTF